MNAMHFVNFFPFNQSGPINDRENCLSVDKRVFSFCSLFQKYKTVYRVCELSSTVHVRDQVVHNFKKKETTVQISSVLENMCETIRKQPFCFFQFDFTSSPDALRRAVRGEILDSVVDVEKKKRKMRKERKGLRNRDQTPFFGTRPRERHT